MENKKGIFRVFKNDRFIVEREGEMSTHSKEAKMNFDQQKVFDLIAEGGNVLVHGAGGVGKSFLLTKLRERFGHETLFLSTTGTSALSIEGSTVHSAMNLPIGFPTPELLRKVSSKTSRLFSRPTVKRIVIDEWSIINTLMLYAFVKRLHRFETRGPNRPARKIQIVFMGDLLQLGNILSDVERALSIEHFGTDKVFEMEEFHDLNFTHVELKKVVRTNDVEFRRMLGDLRFGENLEEVMEYFNKRVEYPLPVSVPVMTTTNALVDLYNNKVFRRNTNNTGLWTATVSNFKANEYPCALNLRLKLGTNVMTLKNDLEERWFNGSTGVVTDMVEQGVYLKFDHSGEIHLVTESMWDKKDYETFENEEGEEELRQVTVGTFLQLPVRQCDSFSIHKAQGKSLDKAIVDLSTGSGWATGMPYVAFSRMTSVEGLYLVRKIRRSDIAVDRQAVEWLKSVLPDILEKDEDLYDPFWDDTPMI